MHVHAAVATPVVTPAYTRETVTSTDREKDTKETVGKSTEQQAVVLSPAEQKQLQELKARDLEVRAHEAAHLAAAGGLALGGASYSYQRGPDGVQYAIGGEVNIDTSAVAGDPEATLQKAQQIRAAALAPAQPSSQDLSVASQAAQLAVEARAEINQQSTKQNQQTNTTDDEDEITPSKAAINDTETKASNEDDTQVLDSFLPPPADLTGNLLDLTA